MYMVASGMGVHALEKGSWSVFELMGTNVKACDALGSVLRGRLRYVCMQLSPSTATDRPYQQDDRAEMLANWRASNNTSLCKRMLRGAHLLQNVIFTLLNCARQRTHRACERLRRSARPCALCVVFEGLEVRGSSGCGGCGQKLCV